MGEGSQGAARWHQAQDTVLEVQVAQVVAGKGRRLCLTPLLDLQACKEVPMLLEVCVHPGLGLHGQGVCCSSSRTAQLLAHRAAAANAVLHRQTDQNAFEHVCRQLQETRLSGGHRCLWCYCFCCVALLLPLSALQCTGRLRISQKKECFGRNARKQNRHVLQAGTRARGGVVATTYRGL